VTLSGTGNHVAVEADSAVACREFPCTDAVVLEAERMIDLGPAPGSLLGIVGMEFAGEHLAGRARISPMN
jgi:hypothetical protein